MKLFLDTADIDEIRTVASWGVLDGVTTNPTLYAKVGGSSYDAILAEICKLTPGPVSAEVVAEDVRGMLEEGRHFAKIADNIVVKVPMSELGLTAISPFKVFQQMVRHPLTDKGIVQFRKDWEDARAALAAKTGD